MSAPDLRFVPVSSAAQVASVAALAREIWAEYYTSLIGAGQVDYMVGKFQSVEAIGAQRDSGYEYYLTEVAGMAVGYLAVQAQPDSLFLSKFYLLKSQRGAGTGRACMEFIERLARERGLALLWLTVNKGNPAVKAYQRMGFQIAAELVMDIGAGYVMDDYRMEKRLAGAGESLQREAGSGPRR